jgi:hypothetical protein
MDHGTEPPTPTPPEGITVRPIHPEDESATMAMFETAFPSSPIGPR